MGGESFPRVFTRNGFPALLIHEKNDDDCVLLRVTKSHNALRRRAHIL
jgi:hypothetical protein